MDKREQAQVDSLVQSIVESPKYRTVDQDLIRKIGSRELTVRRNVKAAIKATKNTLHQIAGAYLDGKPRYGTWVEMLASSVQSGDETQVRQACLHIMQHHASTRERMRILDSFYTTTLAGLQPIRSVLDVACGLNPLAIPWMPLDPEVEYYACDIYTDLSAFLNTCLRLIGVHGQAKTCDLVTAPPEQRVDVALVLKVLPPLEHLHKNSGLDLLRALNANYMLVSFPAHSLGGRDKRMVEHYETWFLKMVRAEGWFIERFEFATELVFRVGKSV